MIIKQKRIKYNSLVNLLDNGFHSFGQSLISTEIILALYLSRFTDSKIVIALIPCLEALLFSISQLFISYNQQKSSCLKSKIIIWGILERIPWLIIGIITLYSDQFHPLVFLSLFFFFYSVYLFCWGHAVPLWFDFMKNIVNHEIKNSFFATIITIRKIFGLVGGLLLAFILSKYSFPYNFSYTFIFAFILMMISLFFFNMNPKILSNIPSEANPPHFSKRLSSRFSILKKDREYFYFLLSMVLFSGLFSIIPFLSTYAKEKFLIQDLSGGIFTAVFFLGQIMGSILCGYWGGKIDYKKMLFFSLAAGTGSLVVAVWAETMIIFYISFFLIGFSLSTRKLSFITFIMDNSRKAKASTYVTVSNNINMPIQMAFPLLSGFIVEGYSYPMLFVIIMLCLAFSLLVLQLSTIKIHENSTVENLPNSRISFFTPQ